MRRILALVAIAALTACASSYYWTGPHVTREEIAQQHQLCEKEIGPPPWALRAGFPSLDREAATDWQGKMAACMYARGFELRTAHEVPPGQAKAATWEKN